MSDGPLSLESMAYAYAAATGCDAARAMQAAFVAAALLADAMGHEKIGDYFSARAAEMEGAEPGPALVPYSPADTQPLFDSRRMTANDVEMERYRYSAPSHP